MEGLEIVLALLGLSGLTAVLMIGAILLVWYVLFYGNYRSK